MSLSLSATQTVLVCLVRMLRARPLLSQVCVEFLLAQLHHSCDSACVAICHALAAIVTQLPVLGESMLGNLLELYSSATLRSSDKQQELLVGVYTERNHLLTKVMNTFY